jgi:FdhD protein
MNARVDAPNDEAPSGLRRVDVRRHEGAEHRPDHDWVIDEAPVAMVYNGVSHVVMMATPTALEDFAVGFSLSEGLLHGVDELRDLRVAHASAGVSVHLDVSPRAFERFKDRRRQLAGRTGCGLCGIDSLQAFAEALPQRTTVLQQGATTADPSTAVRRALQALPQRQALQAQSGGCHAAAWASDDGDIACVREDVGRHNALDKLIGAMALAGQLPASPSLTSAGLVVVSSRASHEMVSKCVRVGVGTLAAISAPTSLAISLAQRNGLRLFGFCRGEAAVAYT